MPKTATNAAKNSSSSSVKTEKEARSEPTPEEIALRAYEIFQSRGEAHGADVDDWLEAERDLRERSA